jgi:hypothetical protein
MTRDRNSEKPVRNRICVTHCYESFPLDTLPATMAIFVEAASNAVGVDPGCVAPTLLSAVGAASGTSRRLRIKDGRPGWTEYPILWTGLVAESGSGKTPAQRECLDIIDDAERIAAREYATALEDHQKAKLLYDVELIAWKRSKDESRGEPPEEPKPPICRRHIISDITIEGVAQILSENPRGVLLYRDEMAGWFGDLTRYHGGQGSDLPHWLPMHSGGAVRVDRRTKPPIYVPCGFVAITGGIQPKIARQIFTPEYFASGLAARMLLVMPPRQPRRWREDVVPDHIRAAMADVFTNLWSLEPTVDANGNTVPVDVCLSPEAKQRFVGFVNEHGQEQYDTTSGDLAAVWSKLEAVAARLALIFHMAHWAAGEDVDVGVVDEVDVHNAVKLVRWFGNEARRVYAILAESEDEEARRELVELIVRMGGEVTARDLQRAKRAKYATAEDAESALNELAEHDLGLWFVDEHDGNRGRPAAVFRIHAASSAEDCHPAPTQHAGQFLPRDTVTCDTNRVFPAKTPIVSRASGNSGHGNGAGVPPWEDPNNEWKP